MSLHSICEMGIYYEVGNKIAFISNKDIETKLIVEEADSRFQENWPSLWASIKETIPGDFPFLGNLEPRKRLVGDISDFFWLTRFDLLTAGVGEKTTEKVLKSIAKSKSATLETCLYALGIEGVGRGLAKELASHYKDIDELGRTPFSHLVMQRGIGGTVAASLVHFFHKESSWWTIERMRWGGVDRLFGWEPPSPTIEDNLVKGKEFMFTGRLSVTRQEASKRVFDLGGYVGSSVRKETDYLVVGEAPGEKVFKAQLLGIRTISEDEFWELVNPRV